MNLYDDVGRHTWVQGYASIFDTIYWHEDCLNVVKPGAFNLTRHRVFSCFEHDHARRVAWTPDKSLKVWQDDVGLGFEFALPKDHSAYGLSRAIAGGVYRACSFCHDGNADFDWVVRGGRQVRAISRLNLTEVSPVRAAANPATGCWLDFEDPGQLPDHVRALRAKWLAGRPQDRPAWRREKAPAAPSAKRARAAHSDPIVDRIAAGWRPRGWAHDLEAFARERRR